MYIRIFLFGALFLFSSFAVADVTILASDFNATYSAANPLNLTENTEIILDENIVISTSEILFNATTTVTLSFTPQNNNKLIVANNTVWNLSTFISQNHKIICKAELITGAGSTILQNGGVIILQDTAWTPQGE